MFHLAGVGLGVGEGMFGGLLGWEGGCSAGEMGEKVRVGGVGALGSALAREHVLG